jgi:hypothetical protein
MSTMLNTHVNNAQTGEGSISLRVKRLQGQRILMVYEWGIGASPGRFYGEHSVEDHTIVKQKTRY